MKSLLVILSLLGSFVHADGWVVPVTGVVDYSGDSQQSLPTFNIPASATVNQPLPQWSNTNPVPTVQDYRSYFENGGQRQ